MRKNGRKLLADGRAEGRGRSRGRDRICVKHDIERWQGMVLV